MGAKDNDPGERPHYVSGTLKRAPPAYTPIPTDPSGSNPPASSAQGLEEHLSRLNIGKESSLEGIAAISSDSASASSPKTPSSPRYLYYQVFTLDGAIESRCSFREDDPYIGRAVPSRITPPHTVKSIKRFLCKQEHISDPDNTYLLATVTSNLELRDQDHLLVLAKDGPGSVADDPMALIIKSSGLTRSIRFVPYLDSGNSFQFEPICRDLKDGDGALHIGRCTSRVLEPATADDLVSSRTIVFKSNVVSRRHAEVWVEAGGKFMIKDAGSSSGTFLNRMRLSPANEESKSHPLNDGDILQLGVQIYGRTDDKYQSVKIRVEIGRK